MAFPVLSLDLAKRTGWCADGLEVCPPRTGTYTLHTSGELRGPAFLRFNEWLYEMVGRTGAKMLAYEAPIIGGAPTGVHQALLLIGLAAQVEMIAASRNIPVVSPAITTIRKYFVGHGRPTNPKRVTLQRCKALGWETGGDDNRADAAALWAFVKATHDKSFRLETSPLFTNPAIRAAGSVA